MKNAFKAGSAYIELFASKKKLKSDLTRTGRDLNRDMKKLGKSSAKKYEKGFDGMSTGKRVGESLKRGVLAGSKGLKKALLGATAVAGVGVAAGATFATIAKGALSAAREIQELADVSGISAERFQEIAFGAKQFGVGGQEVADVLKDMNDRLGDFAQTGAGPLVDFFENIAPRVGLTIDSFRELSSDQALGLYIKALEDAGVNQQDMTFYMEALAGNSTKLLPLLRNNGREMNRLSREARDLGVVLENGAVRQAAEADKKLEQLGERIRVGVTGAIVEAAPEIEALTDKLIELVPTLIGWAEGAIDGITGLAEAWERLKGASGLANGDLFDAKKVETQARKVRDAISLLGTFEDQGRPKELDFVVKLSVEEALGKKAVDEIRKSGKSIKSALIQEQLRLEARVVELGVSDVSANKPKSGSVKNGPNFKSVNSGLSGGGFNASKERKDSEKRLNDLKDQQRRGLEILREKFATASNLLQTAQTPMEQYQARLAELLAFESDALISNAAGGPETFSRLRVQALMEVADATGDYQQAIDELVGLQNGGQISAEQFGQAFTNLAIELDDTTGALGRLSQLSQNGLLNPTAVTAARDAIRQSGEYTTELNEEKLLTLEILAEELEAELHLARLRGSAADVEALERRLAITRETIGLIRQGVDPKKAEKDAEDFVKKQDIAKFEGDVRDAFKGAFRAAIDGDFKGYLSDTLKDAASSMFDRALDSLLDGLFQAFGGSGPFASLFGGGSGGSGGFQGGLGGAVGSVLGSVFAGFFADGGDIPRGQFGIVGEGGGMKHAELVTGPATVTPLKALQNAVGQAPAANDTGPRAMNVYKTYTLSGVDTEKMMRYIDDQDAKTLNEVPGVVSKVNQRQRRASPR